MKRAVVVVQVVTAVAVALAVVSLVVRQPPAPASSRGGDQAVPPGATVYAARCASCHGPDGQGGVGPALAGRVAADLPAVDDEVAVVRSGRNNRMPAFAGVLSDQEVRDVVAFTRQGLGGPGSGTAPGGSAVPAALDGQALYADRCAGCHGERGEGTYAPVLAGGAVNARHPADGELVTLLLQGTGDMPGLAGRLTPEEAAAVVAYVRTLP